MRLTFHNFLTADCPTLTKLQLELSAADLVELSPALADVRGAVDQVTGLRARPAGRVRLVTSRIAARMVLAPKLAQFAREFPDVQLELTTTEESRLDLVGAGFDAGIHLGEFVERDMVAVRVSREQRAAIVAAPSFRVASETEIAA